MCLVVALSSASSPSRAESPHALHLPVDIGLTAAFAAGAGLFQWTAPETFVLPCHPCGPQLVNELDRVAVGRLDHGWDTATDVMLGVAMASPVLASGLYALTSAERAHLEGWLTDGLLAGEAIMGTLFLAQIAKHAVGRQRPFTYAMGAEESSTVGFDASRSFFSGHTAAAFAGVVVMASTVSRQPLSTGWKVGAWTGGLALATTVGVGRVMAARHFPTDVIAGAAVGTLVGWLVPWLHRRSASESDQGLATTELRLAPLGLAGTF